MDIICNQESGTRKAIQSAIDALPEEGGRVIIPAGNWESGPIRLRSHVDLYLEPGAEVWFQNTRTPRARAQADRGLKAHDIVDHEMVGQNGISNGISGQTAAQNRSCPASIFADHASCITISGRGTFHAAEGSPGHPHSQTRSLPVGSLISMCSCDRILLKEFRIEGNFRTAIQLRSCYGARIDSLHIHASGEDINGIDTHSCAHMEIIACRLDTSGNGIMISAGPDQTGSDAGTGNGTAGAEMNLCRDIELKNCYFDNNKAAIEIGSSLSGGVEAVHVKRCMIQDVERGISLPAVSRKGGYIRHCRFEDIQISRAAVAAIDFRDSRPARMTDLNDICLTNIYGEENGLDLAMEHLSPRQKKGIVMQDIALE